MDYKIKGISTALIQSAENLEVQRFVDHNLVSAPLAESYMSIYFPVHLIWEYCRCRSLHINTVARCLHDFEGDNFCKFVTEARDHFPPRSCPSLSHESSQTKSSNCTHGSFWLLENQDCLDIQLLTRDRLALISPKYCPLQETDRMPWLLEFSELRYLFRPSSFQILCFWQFGHLFTAISREETVDYIPALPQSPSDGPDNPRYLQHILQYSDLRRYPLACSGSSSSIFGKGGFIYFSGPGDWFSLVPRHLAFLQDNNLALSTAPSLTSSKQSLTLYYFVLCKTFASVINCFIDIKEHDCHTFLCKASTLCPQAVSGFCKRNEYSRHENTLFFTSTPSALHHDSTTSF